MLHSATWTGLRTLAGDYREDDIRRADIRRVAVTSKAADGGAPEGDVAPRIAFEPIARLLKLLPHAR